ncbi:MAG: hypothetical protein Q8934_03605 [Bacillota bacterium]|nr:hypothetical protein [Bacillota bacterium]
MNRNQVSLELPEYLEMDRSQIEKTLFTAQEKVRTFAASHNWGLYANEALIKKTHIFSTKNEFDYAVITAFDLNSNTVLPLTVSAIIANDELLMVSPNVYAEIYPQGKEENSYKKLIIHELAHALHIRILNGDEEKMGPKWFFEGFAIYAAKQFESHRNILSDDEIWEIILTDKETNYQSYKEVMDFLLEKVSINELVAHAWKSNFLEFLQSTLG